MDSLEPKWHVNVMQINWRRYPEFHVIIHPSLGNFTNSRLFILSASLFLQSEILEIVLLLLPNFVIILWSDQSFSDIRFRNPYSKGIFCNVKDFLLGWDRWLIVQNLYGKMHPIPPAMIFLCNVKPWLWICWTLNHAFHLCVAILCVFEAFTFVVFKSEGRFL